MKKIDLDQDLTRFSKNQSWRPVHAISHACPFGQPRRLRQKLFREHKGKATTVPIHGQRSPQTRIAELAGIVAANQTRAGRPSFDLTTRGSDASGYAGLPRQGGLQAGIFTIILIAAHARLLGAKLQLHPRVEQPIGAQKLGGRMSNPGTPHKVPSECLRRAVWLKTLANMGTSERLPNSLK